MSDESEEQQDNTSEELNDVLSGPSLNSKASQSQRTTSYETAKRRLIQRYGYKEDELEALFKTEAELVEFYNKTLKEGLNRRNKEAEDEIDWDADDDFDLSEEEKKRLQAKKDSDSLAEFASRDQSKLKPDARVAPEDLLQVQKDLKDLLGEEI